MNFGGFGGPRPGYVDPLSHGGFGGMGTGGMPGMGMQPTSSLDVGGALQDILRRTGGGVSSAVDWLTDKDEGANRTNLLFGGAGLLANLYGAHQQGKREDRLFKQNQEDRERDRSRQSAAEPYRQELLEELMARLSEHDR